MKIPEIHYYQQQFFHSNKTKEITYRISQLKKLKSVLKENENKMYEAIYKDFNKSEFETYASELALIYHEINVFIKNIKKWSKRKKVRTGWANFPASSYIIPEPLGNTLVIGAWNYPYQLSLVPAITAIAAGNTVILKPSEIPSQTSKVMAEIINQNFPKEFFTVIEGGVEETSQLLELKFDKIFFTGSIPVGKIIYKAAAKSLTPVTLELGGKSPAIVLKDTNISMTAKRLVWAKFLNAGQTCIAPDYVLVDKSIEKPFLEAIKTELDKNHEHNYLQTSENYVKIINDKNFDRLQSLIMPEKVFYGGNCIKEERHISPTIMTNVNLEDEIMQDEIFGPILPIMTFSNVDNAIDIVKQQPKPLACYVYSKNRKLIDKILQEISFGGGAVNDSVMHITNSKLPFGGVGSSGIGSYHGKFGFDTFTHYKSILDKPFWYDFDKNPPFSKTKLKLIKFLME